MKTLKLTTYTFQVADKITYPLYRSFDGYFLRAAEKADKRRKEMGDVGRGASLMASLGGWKKELIVGCIDKEGKKVAPQKAMDNIDNTNDIIKLESYFDEMVILAIQLHEEIAGRPSGKGKKKRSP